MKIKVVIVILLLMGTIVVYASFNFYFSEKDNEDTGENYLLPTEIRAHPNKYLNKTITVIGYHWILSANISGYNVVDNGISERLPTSEDTALDTIILADIPQDMINKLENYYLPPSLYGGLCSRTKCLFTGYLKLEDWSDIGSVISETGTIPRLIVTRVTLA